MGKALRLEEQHGLAHMAVAVSEETVWQLFLTLGSYVAKYKDAVISISKSWLYNKNEIGENMLNIVA